MLLSRSGAVAEAVAVDILELAQFEFQVAQFWRSLPNGANFDKKLRQGRTTCHFSQDFSKVSGRRPFPSDFLSSTPNFWAVYSAIYAYKFRNLRCYGRGQGRRHGQAK
jgi:hypothetical protein